MFRNTITGDTTDEGEGEGEQLGGGEQGPDDYEVARDPITNQPHIYNV